MRRLNALTVFRLWKIVVEIGEIMKAILPKRRLFPTVAKWHNTVLKIALILVKYDVLVLLQQDFGVFLGQRSGLGTGRDPASPRFTAIAGDDTTRGAVSRPPDGQVVANVAPPPATPAHSPRATPATRLRVSNTHKP